MTDFQENRGTMQTRHFEYQDAKSDKFWEISLDGARFTVRWGRRGSAGQSKTKEFGSEAAAKLAHEKLVAEKLREGYTEGAVTGPAPAARPVVRKPAQTATPPTASSAREAARSAPAAQPPTPEPAEASSLPDPPASSIDLDPDDWRWATWRSIPPIALPQPAPFDREACSERLRRSLPRAARARTARRR
jgi:predicted DNA-binding WGR domain protein